MHPPTDPLDPLLERWRLVAPRLEGSVRDEVWRRLRTEPAGEARPGWRARLEAVFAQPAFAVAFVTVCMLLGLFLAEMRLTRLQAERNDRLARSYVRLIDPRLENPPPSGGLTVPRR